MKIAFILSSFPCLSETFILSQITGLLDRGHDLRILAKNNPKKAVVHHDFEKYCLQKRTRYFSTPKNNKFKKRLFFILKFFKCFCLSPLCTPRIFFHLLKEKEGFSYTTFDYMAPFLMRKDDVVHCHFGTIGHVGVLSQS